MNDTHTTKRKVSPSFGLRFNWRGYSPEQIFERTWEWMTYTIHDLAVEVNDGSGWRRPASSASVEDIMEYIEDHDYEIPIPIYVERTLDSRNRYEFWFAATPI